jgi:hypothetical protein
MAVQHPFTRRNIRCWLDSGDWLSCENSTHRSNVDAEHQPTDLTVGGSNPSASATRTGRLPACSLMVLPAGPRWVRGRFARADKSPGGRRGGAVLAKESAGA